MSGGLFAGLEGTLAKPVPPTLAKPDHCACGAPHPSFGFGVSLLRGRIGRWACGAEACRARAEKGDRG